MTRDEMISLLKSNHCLVTFMTVRGLKREMPCTLMESRLPPPGPAAAAKVEATVVTGHNRMPNENVISVWCTDKEAWRSFRVDSVERIDLIIG